MQSGYQVLVSPITLTCHETDLLPLPGQGLNQLRYRHPVGRYGSGLISICIILSPLMEAQPPCKGGQLLPGISHECLP